MLCRRSRSSSVVLRRFGRVMSAFIVFWTEFFRMLRSEAKNACIKNKKKTIMEQHVMEALDKMVSLPYGVFQRDRSVRVFRGSRKI